MSGEITLSPGNLRVLTLRIVHPMRGVWLADLELDPDVLSSAPSSGKVTITVHAQSGSFALQGTIDPRGSGGFVEFYHLRVLGGGAGWDQLVKPRDYQADGGLTTADVYATTATEAGEVVRVAVPEAITHFVRAAGPASRVLEGEDEWYVDTAGVTQVGPRPASTLDASAVLVRWDPSSQVADLTCDALVFPGTTISDPRIPSGPVTVRDVEQVFDAAGSHVTAWCGLAPVSQFAQDLRAMVVEFSGKKFLQSYMYRIVLQNADGRLQLQPVDGTLGLPDLLPVPTWWGLAGAGAKFRPGTFVLVRFVAGDPSQPVVEAYQPGALPLESTLDASAVLHLGPSAASVSLAGGATPLVPAPWADALRAALVAFASGLNSTTLPAQGAALLSALAALPPDATTKVTAT